MCPSFDPNAHKETPLGISALTPPSRPEDVVETVLEFPDNRLLIGLCGEFDRNLAQIEHQMGVHVLRRGNRLSVIGDAGAREQAAAVLRGLYARLETGRAVSAGDIDGAIRMGRPMPDTLRPDSEQIEMFSGGAMELRTRKKPIEPRTEAQKAYVANLFQHELGFGIGPAGTGKTYLAVAKAVEALEAGKVGRIVLSRPAVEAGESIGFLPGDMEDKLAPYLRPLYDALSDRLSMKRVKALMAEGLIEIAPIGYMRGRTLNNAFIVVDEAQNCTYVQLKMLLTRLGWHSTMVVTGDPHQSDLLPGVSGLADISARLEAVDNIAVVRLAERDIVRHPLVASMIGVL